MRLKNRKYLKDRAWIELDRDALRHNVAALRSLLPKGCSLMPVLKADAYGHGAVAVAKELEKMGVRSFCVACISEAIDLRRHGIRGDILILGYTHPELFPLLRRYRLTQTIVDAAYGELLGQYGKRLRVQIGIDTGMHRLGERAEHLDKLCGIFSMKNLKIEGAFTHLCTDDTESANDQAFTIQQAERFFRVIHELEKKGHICPKVHLQASYGVLNYPELAGDFARVGIALYGVKSARTDYDRFQADLRPVLSLKARVSSVRELAPGESAGYGLTFTADRPTRLASLAIGYADGLPRSLSDGMGQVLLNGKKAPIAGRICMDQTLVDVTELKTVQPGDTAVLIGRQGDEELSVYEAAEAAGTITNEILSRLGRRLTRV